MGRILTAWLAIAIGIGASMPAAAITRTCSASMHVSLYGKTQLDYIAALVGRGACSSDTNDCRRNARKEIDRCLATVWRDHRFSTQLPIECTRGTSSRPGTIMSWEGIRLSKLPRTLFNQVAHSACCMLGRDRGMVSADVSGTISGAKGCAQWVQGDHTQTFYGLVTVTLDCHHWRTQGICG